jgi:Na+/H+ antiporter NhaD/arsenite permease-like protein
VVVFFIFLVANIGGVLTPVGDPPLFLGFLRGIDFFWATRALWPQALFASGVLLAIFFLVDSYFGWREEKPPPAGTAVVKLRVSGHVNIGLIGIAILAIVASGFWRPGIGFDLLGTRIELQNLIRELVMVSVGLASLRVTKPALRAANGFEWEPIREVAYLFAGIFICIIPVMAMLEAGAKGPFSRDQCPDSFGWNARQRGLFLGDGRPLLLPRQYADISCVFSARRRRPRGAHGSARQDIDGDFARRGVHGRQHLHRQCA